MNFEAPSFKVPMEKADQIALFALYADKSVNLDLKRQIINSKKEYMSAFSKRFTGFLNGPLSSGLTADSVYVPHKHKKDSGCDITFVINCNELSKIAIAKYNYPNFENPLRRWDKIKKSSGQSRFTTQINKQQKYAEQYAVIQKFLNSQIKKQHQQMMEDSASCVWHSDVMSFRESINPASESIWDVKRLFEMFNVSEVLDIGSIFRMLCLEPIAVTVTIDNGIEDFIREKKLPSKVILINVLD